MRRQDVFISGQFFFLELSVSTGGKPEALDLVNEADRALAGGRQASMSHRQQLARPSTEGVRSAGFPCFRLDPSLSLFDSTR